MKTKFGALIVDGRGKIGGHVASSGRGGSYLRTKVTPTNPRSGSQLGIRNRFTFLSQAWRGLTQQQRDAWNAATSAFARTNIFGDLRNPSGINLYQRLNNVLLSIGQAILTDPPAPAEVASVVISSVVPAIGAGEINIQFAPAVPAGTAVKIYATAPQSAGKSFIKSELRLIDVMAAAQVSPRDIMAAWEAKFGQLSGAGQKIFVELVPVNIATGQVGAPSQAAGIIQA